MNKNNLTDRTQYDKNIDELECLIHGDILVNPVLCQNSNCEFIQCKKCVDLLPKLDNKKSKCPNCQEGHGFTKTGTKNVRTKLDKLFLKCVKCDDVHFYAEAANCTLRYCKTCCITQNEKKIHQCFSCWRCNKQFKTVEQLKEHLNKCNPNHDQNYKKQVRNSISDMWKIINQINRKVSFVFNSIWTLLENKNLTKDFKTYNQDQSNEDKIIKFIYDIGNKRNEDQLQRTEFISELDMLVYQENESLEIQDCFNCKKIGSLDTNQIIESIGQSPSFVIDQYTNLKNRQGIIKGEGEGEELECWTERMLQMVAKAIPVPDPVKVKQEDPIQSYKIIEDQSSTQKIKNFKNFGDGTFEILNGGIKKTSDSKFNSMLKFEDPLRQGIHEIKVRIDNSPQNDGIFIGFMDEFNTDPSYESIQNNSIGIYNKGSSYNHGLNRHHKEWKAFAGDIIEIKIDFNKGTIEFQLGGSIIADADFKDKGWSTLYFVICLGRKGSSVKILEQE